jgi:glycine cleavage system aminomethyltransferase T
MDLTPMYKYEIKGERAKEFINYFVTRDLSNMDNNTVAYVIWCNEEGKFVDD